MYKVVLLVISNCILMAYTNIYLFSSSPVNITPIYSAGTSNFSVQQPQNYTYPLLWPPPRVLSLFASTSTHGTSNSHPYLYFSVILTLQ